MAPAPPPVLQHLLLESPWAVAVTLAAVGIVLGLVGRRGGPRWLAHATWVGLPLALAVVLLARFVTTDREAAIARTRELINTTAPWDVPQLLAMFEPGATLVGPNGNAWLDLAQLRGEVSDAASQFPVVRQSFDRLEAEARADGTAITALSLRTTFDPQLGMALPVPSRWQLTWRMDDTGVYRVTQVQWLELMNQPAQQGVWP